MKINKITPQIAALYLGQKCELSKAATFHQYSLSPEFRIGEIRPVNIRVLKGLESGDYEFILHLRRLESLTEDEARELYELEVGIRPGNDRNCVDWWSEFNPLDYKNSEIAIGSPAVWLKLLEWGIDLFGLIDSGLAKEIEPTDENGLTASDYYHGITYPNG